MLVTDLDEAKTSLAEREGISEQNIQKYLGYWPGITQSPNESSDIIGKWASNMGLDAVVWTALPPKFDSQTGRVPTVDEVLSFLRTRTQEQQKNAEEYIRKAPRQVDTEYRRRIEAELSWTPVGEI
jgi:hypothetical protein